MILQGDEAEVLILFYLDFGHGANLTQDRYTVCAECTIGSKLFWTHPMVLLGDGAQVKARLSPFVDSVNLDA
jgi:hypothetical protein